MSNPHKVDNYYLAVYHSHEGWSLDGYETTEEIIEVITSGQTYGNEYRILKGMNFKMEIVEESNDKK